jgi:predicted dehydrogenase
VSARAKLIKPEVDSRMEAIFEFPDGIAGHVVCDMLTPRLFDSFLHVRGDAGEMSVLSPFQPHWFHWLTIRTSKGTHRGMIKGENAYASQLRTFARAIRGEGTLSTNPTDAVNNMRLIDAIYEKAGLALRGSRS